MTYVFTDMKKVSIIMPYKNPDQFFAESIQSIQNQTFSNWELIAVNDHSSDHSSSYITTVAKTDPRIIHLKNNGEGIIDALNTGYAHVSGDLLTRMDADDVMPTNRLELMVNKLQESPPKTVVTGLVKYISDHPISEGYLKYENWLNELNTTNTQWQKIYR